MPSVAPESRQGRDAGVSRYGGCQRSDRRRIAVRKRNAGFLILERSIDPQRI